MRCTLAAVIAGGLLFGPAKPASAQAGVPGGRIDSAREHRAAVRAESYSTVAGFFARWREAWNEGRTDVLARLYLDDASARLPGQSLVQGGEALGSAMRDAVARFKPIAMSDVDFDSDGQTSVVVSRYFMERDGVHVTGIVTAVLIRAGRSWRLRMHIFDEATQPTDPLPRT